MHELPREIRDAITERCGECREYFYSREARRETDDIPMRYGHIRYNELDRRTRR